MTIASILEQYAITWCTTKYDNQFNLNRENQSLQHFKQFITSQPELYKRYSYPGHFTGSAMVASPDLNFVLLTLHKKLNIWLQLGGHADGDWQLDRVALKEAEEESGLTDLSFLDYRQIFAVSDLGVEALPFDIDCHCIPAFKNEPAHYHYDVRYIVIADLEKKTALSSESHDLRWFSLEQAKSVTSERSMHRQFSKLQFIKNQLRL